MNPHHKNTNDNSLFFLYNKQNTNNKAYHWFDYICKNLWNIITKHSLEYMCKFSFNVSQAFVEFAEGRF